MSRTNLGRALRNRAILSYSLGHFAANVGTWMQRVGVGWLTYDLTGSAGWVGVIVACEIVPAILLAPFGGVLADRSDHLALVRLCQILALMQVLVLAGLAAAGLLPVWALALVTLALGVIEGMAQPARLVVISDIATGPLIPVAITLSSFGFNTARFMGPALAGATLVTGGPALTFLGSAIAYAIFLGVLSVLLRSHRGRRVRHAAGEGGILVGLRHAAGHPVVAPMMLLLCVVALFARPFAEILPAISAEFVDRSPAALAAMMASVGVGAMLGGVFTLYRDGLTAIVTSALAAPGGLVAAILAFVLTYQWYWPTFIALAVAGFCMVQSGIGMQSAIHMTVDKSLRGRVLSLFGLVFRGGPAVGALGIGFAGDRFGLALPLGAAAALCGIVWAVVWIRRERILAATRSIALTQAAPVAEPVE